MTGNGDHLSLDDMLIKNATGPNIKNFFIGSEGIYGLTTSCRMQLIKKPDETKVVLIGFNNLSSLDEITNLILKFDVEAIEFFTKNSLNQVEKEFKNIDTNNLDNDYYLIIEIYYQKEFTEDLEKIYNAQLAEEIIISTNNSQKESIWQYRLLISESISRSSPIKFDVAVPLKNVTRLIYELETLLEKNKFYTLILFGHLGDGNLHINIIKNTEFAESKDISLIQKNIKEIIINLGGTLSAEHGIGANKLQEFMNHESKIKIGIIQNLKKYFDHKKILNPGKLVE